MNRFRRLRQNQAIRRLVQETEISPKDLIYPIFIIEGENIKEPIESMPGVYRYSIDKIDEILEEVSKSGISGMLLFGVPAHKDSVGSEAYNENGVTQRAIRYIKAKYPNMLVIADICLCEYTSHGHCGLISGNEILNDETLPLLAKAALTNVQAGADMVAPSDMMDGRVRAIRTILDQNQYTNIPIMSYAVKYASAFYGPFREAADSAPAFGDRKSYQMDFHNRKEARKEVMLDVEEGADIIMVKPALSYLDIVRETAQSISLPVAAYSVSGEYAMIKAAAQAGWVDEEKIVCETAVSVYRAGAGILLTYYAKELAGWIKEGRIG